MAKKIEKAIIWRRGSTDRQEIESQGKDLTAIAVNEGFEVSNLIHIGKAGASAIKQNDLYMQEVNELLNTLENDKSVKTVFVWEISRLARVELAFYQMKDYLIKNHIQLICKTPSLRLFDADGTVNKGTELTLSLLVTLAKQEMEIKFERFARGKARNKAEGKYNGGKIKLGYKLDASKHFVIDEEGASIVRNMFDMYINGGHSCNSIWKHYVDLGHFNIANRAHSGSFLVSRILKDKTYCGANPNIPAIVSEETIDAAIAKMESYPKRHKTKHVFYAKSIMKDAATDTTYCARMSNLTYSMRYQKDTRSLNLNVIDYVTWFVASYLKNIDLNKERETNKTIYAAKIVENETIISNKQKQIEESQGAIDRAIQTNIMQPKHFSTEKMNAVVDAMDKRINELENDIKNLQTDNERMKNILDGIENLESAINYTGEYTDEMKKQIIDSVIQEIRVEILDDQRRHYKIQFINKVGYVDNSWWEYKFNTRMVQMVQHTANGATLDFTDIIAQNKRFERKR